MGPEFEDQINVDAFMEAVSRWGDSRNDGSCENNGNALLVDLENEFGRNIQCMELNMQERDLEIISAISSSLQSSASFLGFYRLESSFAKIAMYGDCQDEDGNTLDSDLCLTKIGEEFNVLNKNFQEILRVIEQGIKTGELS